MITFIPYTSYRMAAQIRTALGYRPRECFVFGTRAGKTSCPYYLAVPDAHLDKVAHIKGVRFLRNTPRGNLRWCES